MRWLLLTLLLCAPFETAHAQWLDPDTCWTCKDKIVHAAGGAALNALVRGPWIAPGWRDTVVKRMAWVMALGCVVYELHDVYESHERGWLGKPGGGFGWLDCIAVGVGGLTTELVVRLL